MDPPTEAEVLQQNEEPSADSDSKSKTEEKGSQFKDEMPSKSEKEEHTLEENFDIEFRKKVNETLNRLRKLPTSATEMELPKEKRGMTDVYIKLCKALKVPLNSTFMSCVEGDEMDYSYQCIGPIGVVAITKALIMSQTVKDLNLAHNKLGARSLRAIASLLNQNENITLLNLASNEINKNSTDELRGLIAACYCVEFLDLSGNNLGDAEFVEIAASLVKVDGTKELNLSYNDAGPDCGLAFGSSISKCSALERLDLSGNHLEEGASGLFGTLKSSNLKHLNFSRNGILDEAMPDVAKGLRGNRSLKELDLSGNYITKKGIAELAPGVKKSTTLEVLRLAGNPFDGLAANVILSSTGSNLKLLDLSNIKVNLTFMKTLDKYKKSGKELKVLFGSTIRYDVLPRGIFQPKDEPVTKSNALNFMQKLADEKEVSLKHALKDIQAKFIAQKVEQALQTDEGPGNASVSEMTTNDFAKGLTTSELSVPKAVAQEFSEALSVDGMLDLFEIIPKIKWRPDDIAVKVKSKKKEPSSEKSKDKKKKKK